MSAFSEEELAYLAEGKLGRLATIDPAGFPQKFHNVQREPKVAFIVDDVLPPWKPRCIMVRGTAAAIPAGRNPAGEAIIRITPEKIVSWGLNDPG